MDQALFNRLVEKLGPLEEIVESLRSPAQMFEVDAEKVQEIRALTGLSQPRFAKLFRVDLETLRNWEQGRRIPRGPARALLNAIQMDPEGVLTALAARMLGISGPVEPAKYCKKAMRTSTNRKTED